MAICVVQMVHGGGREMAALCDLARVHVDRRLRRAASLPPDFLAEARAVLAPEAAVS